MKWLSLKLIGGAWLVSTTLIARTPANTYTITPQEVKAAQAVDLISLPEELMRAGGCESSNSATSTPRQFNKDGSVVTHFNKDGSVDRGAFQINSVHDKEAKELGLDPKKEADNYKLALMIYKKQGIGAWKGYSAAERTCSYYL